MADTNLLGKMFVILCSGSSKLIVEFLRNWFIWIGRYISSNDLSEKKYLFHV